MDLGFARSQFPLPNLRSPGGSQNYIEMLQTHSVNECDRPTPQATALEKDRGLASPSSADVHRLLLLAHELIAW